MEVIVAKTAGFCFGVERAVEKVYKQTESDKKIYTYGPIIHNDQVVGDLEKKGVTVINGLEKVKEIKESAQYYKTAKPGSLAEKAGMVAKYNEKSSKNGTRKN